VCLVQRFQGFRISDTIALPRGGLNGNRISLTTQKTGARIEGMIVPDEVAKALAALPDNRPGFRPGYFFWLEGRNSVESLATFWHDKIFSPLNAYLDFKDERGEPMWFRPHMLRDTFAVQNLLNDVPLEEVSKLLSHSSLQITERHYAPWVKSRREKLERNFVESLRAMGMTVTVN